MKVTRSKVNYTEVQVTMDMGEVRDVLAEHIKATKNVEVTPDGIKFDVAVDEFAEGGPDYSVFGVTATVVKRGRVQRNGKPKPAVTDSDLPEEMQSTEAPAKPKMRHHKPDENGKVKLGKKTKKLKKVKAEVEDLDEPDEG